MKDLVILFSNNIFIEILMLVICADMLLGVLRAIEYSCAMKSHFRKFGNQMSGSGNHLCNYVSLLA